MDIDQFLSEMGIRVNKTDRGDRTFEGWWLKSMYGKNIKFRVMSDESGNIYDPRIIIEGIIGDVVTKNGRQGFRVYSKTDWWDVAFDSFWSNMDNGSIQNGGSVEIGN